MICDIGIDHLLDKSSIVKTLTLTNINVLITIFNFLIGFGNLCKNDGDFMKNLGGHSTKIQVETILV
jgi:hypothetical protein